MATPLMIEIGIHYHCIAVGDYCPERFDAPGVQTVLRDFAEAGLLRPGKDRAYDPTGGLAAWIEALCQVPFPKRVWRVDRPADGQGTFSDERVK